MLLSLARHCVWLRSALFLPLFALLRWCACMTEVSKASAVVAILLSCMMRFILVRERLTWCPQDVVVVTGMPFGRSCLQPFAVALGPVASDEYSLLTCWLSQCYLVRSCYCAASYILSSSLSRLTRFFSSSDYDRP